MSRHISRHATERTPRECRGCGATLSGWWCDACGGNSVETVARAYIAELAAPWRSAESARRRAEAAEPPVRLAA